MFYPDNPNRSQRCQDLANNIAIIQTDMKDTLNTEKAADARVVEALNNIAKAKGFSTVDDYVKSVIALLPEDEKKAITELRDKVAKQGGDVKLAMDISMTVLGIALLPDTVIILKSVATVVARQLGAMVNWIVANQAVLNFLNLGGEAANVVEAAGIELQEIAAAARQGGNAAAAGAGAPAADVGVEAAGGAARFARLCTIIGRVVTVAAVLVTIGVLIDDAVEGAKQRDAMRGYINELVPKRFAARKLQLQFKQAFSFKAEARALLFLQDSLQPLVDNGTMTADQLKTAVATSLQKTATKYAKEQEPFDDEHKDQLNKSIHDELDAQDKSHSSWTNEDPDLNGILKWLTDHANDKPAS